VRGERETSHVSNKEKEKEKEKEQKITGNIAEGEENADDTDWPHYDLLETETRIEIHVDLPGVNDEDVKAEYYDNKLVIKGIFIFLLFSLFFFFFFPFFFSLLFSF
jgi:HSP20 family molecular chaperone IbpA